MNVMKLVQAASLSPFKFNELLENMEKAVKSLLESKEGARAEIEMRLLHLMEMFEDHVSGTLANFHSKAMDEDKLLKMFTDNDSIMWARELLEAAASSSEAVSDTEILENYLESCECAEEVLVEKCGWQKPVSWPKHLIGEHHVPRLAVSKEGARHKKNKASDRQSD